MDDRLVKIEKDIDKSKVKSFKKKKKALEHLDRL